MQQLNASVPIEVHTPACNALYSCEPKCDTSDYRASVDGLGPECFDSVSALEDQHAGCEQLWSSCFDRVSAVGDQHAGLEQNGADARCCAQLAVLLAPLL